MKALYVNFINNKNLQGASTITQQYAKNLFLDFDKNWSRKIKEAWLTIRLEVQYSKEEILEGYLNTINYGGIFGIENASKYYFNKSSSELSIAEASILAGIPKSPSYYSPINNEENAKERQKTVLNAMLNNKFINKEEYEEALATSLTYIGNTNKNNSKTLMYYQDAVLQELNEIKQIPKSFLTTGGLKIYTNLDLNAQNALEKGIYNYYNSNDEIQVAGIMIDPNTGGVIALTGGMDYQKSQYNRAIQSKRAIGSTIKPFLYYAALENGFTPSTTFTSEKTTFVFSDGELYSPTNYGDKYPNKEISLVSAIAYSDNIYAVKTHLFLGENVLVDTLKKVGIKEELLAVPSLALGSMGISLIDLMTGYNTLASGGYKLKTHFITKIEDVNGNILYEHQSIKEPTLNSSLVYILNEMLTATSNSSFIDYAYPTCYTISSKLKEKYSIKSGTTQYDNLVIGYNKNILLGLWSGYDDNRLVTSDNSYKLKNSWADTLLNYELNGDNWYDMPNNVIGTIIDTATGKIATEESKKKAIMYYIKGTEP